MDLLETLGGGVLAVADSIGAILYRPALGVALCAAIAPVAQADCTAFDGNEVWCHPNTYILAAHAALERHPELVNGLEAVGRLHGLPPHTLPVMAAVESRMGELNVDNGQGYAGIFQGGKAEYRRYGIRNRPSLDRVNSTVMAVNYAKENLKRLPWRGDYRDAYYAHQQGLDGYLTALKLRSGKLVSPRKTRVAVQHLANNLPNVVRDKVAVRVGKRWRLRYNVTPQRLAKLYFIVWDEELKRLV